MRVKLQRVLCDDGQEETVTDVVTLKKDHRRIEHLGLTLAEAKQLLNTIQHRVLQLHNGAFTPPICRSQIYYLFFRQCQSRIPTQVFGNEVPTGADKSYSQYH
jgi:hypothetical protein